MIKQAAIFTICLCLLTGCSSNPAPTPEPTVMSDAESGDLYLRTVCPINAAADELFAALNEETADISKINHVAAKMMDAQTKSAEIFDDSSILWPESVKNDMQTMAEDAFSTLSWLSQIKSASTVEETFIPMPDTQEANTASQRIRSRLKLSPDTTASCLAFK